MDFVLFWPICAGLLASWALVSRACAIRRNSLLQSKLQEYEDRLYYKGEISNEIAHDIKNPLTAILCSAEALEIIAGPKLDPESRKTLRYIREYGDQMLKLITDFLDVSLAEAGRLRVNPEKIRMKDAVDSVVVLLKSTASIKNVSLRIANSDENLTAYFDPKHFKQVLFNLVHNAIKFTPNGGRVTVSVIQLSDFESVCISVSDTGPGIPPDALKTIFDPYSAEARGLHQKEKGTGIGLALCKNLMNLGSGSIQVRSVPGEGSTFDILFPLAEPDEQAIETIGQMLKPLEGQHVLIVDKDIGARETMATLINALGGIADTADEIEGALKSLMKHTYNAVMIDSKADEGAGYALAKIIKHDLDAKGTKIILAGDGIIDQLLAKEFGVDTCVQKPLNGKQLIQSIL